MIFKFLLYGLAGYTLLCILVFLFQRKMLYFPDTTKITQDHADREGFSAWPGNENFKGFISNLEPDQPKGTILIFHGNAGNALDRSFYSKALNRQGFRVILAEYPGYGGRTGSPSEDRLVTDALEIIALAHKTYPEPVFLWGESLGCGVAAAAIRQTQVPVQGLVMFLPWDCLSDLARTHYPYLPVGGLIRDRYDSVANLQGFKGRLAVLLAGDDEIIPVKHGHNLYHSIQTDKKIWVFEGATHNDMPVAPGLDWWKELTAFLLKGASFK